MKSARKVALAIKLGEELELNDFKLTLIDMIGYFKHNNTSIGTSDEGDSVISCTLMEDVSFYVNGIHITRANITH